MLHIRALLVTIVAIWVTIYGPPSQATNTSDTPGFDHSIRHLPGYSAQLSPEFCKSAFPYHKVIADPIFKLFAFTTRPFDSKKPSVITIHGGPGGLWSPGSAMTIANAFPDFNVVFFHYRGGGCSTLNEASAVFDLMLTSDGVVSDLEAIRAAYGVSRWQAVLGWSYGTNIARLYANKFPNSMGFLVLEGLASYSNEEELNVEQQVQRLLSSMEVRLQTSSQLARYAKLVDVNSFLSKLREYFGQIDPKTNFGYAAAWDTFKVYFDGTSATGQRTYPKHYSLPTFQAISLLMYVGESDEADVAILVLLEQFGLIVLDSATRESNFSYLTDFDKMFFPFKYKNYTDVFDKGLLVSWRVQLKMVENDLTWANPTVCHTKAMIVLNGSKDLATPAENVDLYLKDKNCAAGPSVSLIVEGGGHSNLTNSKCLLDYVTRSLVVGTPSYQVPTRCQVPVAMKSY